MNLSLRTVELLAKQPKEEIQRFIKNVERWLATFEQTEVPLRHIFSDGIYAREATIPANTFAVGKIHKGRTMNCISKGKVTVISIDGVKTLEAPCTFVSQPGAKRFVYTHEETVWTNFHATNETDVEKIEDEFIVKEQLCLG